MKILFFTDIHLRSFSDRPKWRTDDHYKTQFEELAEISALAKLHKADLLISGGDFLHYPRVSHGLVSDILAWCKTLPCAFYTVVGNHDVYGYRTDDVKSSGLGVLLESEAINNLGDFDLVWEGQKVIIRGVHVYLNPREGNYLFDEKYKDYYKLIISHNFIIPEPVIFDAVFPKDVKTNANIVALGHYHQQFYHMEGSTHFINPGSIARWSVNEQHQPQVILLDTETQIITRIPLKCSKSAAEIFDLAAVRDMKEQEMNLEQFVDSLENTSFENVDLEQIILTQGQTQAIHKDIIDLALSKVRVAKEELK